MTSFRAAKSPKTNFEMMALKPSASNYLAAGDCRAVEYGAI
jgi:hypothetical protein